jgi:hypothetical protein
MMKDIYEKKDPTACSEKQTQTCEYYYRNVHKKLWLSVAKRASFYHKFRIAKLQ